MSLQERSLSNVSTNSKVWAKRSNSNMSLQERPLSNDSSSSKRIVEVRITFLKITTINTVNDAFSGKVQVESIWHEPELDRLASQELDSYKYESEKYWNPCISIENKHGDVTQRITDKTTYKLSRDETRTYVHEYQKHKSGFYENMELTQFPCDTQELSVRCVSSRSNDEIDLTTDLKSKYNRIIEGELPRTFTDHGRKDTTFYDGQTWHLHREVTTKRDKICDYEEDSKPGIVHTATVTRKCGYFIWNFVLIMNVITLTMFAPFALDNYGGRMKLFFTMMLTQVAFKFSSSNSLPKVSYLTYLDKYVISTMIFMAGISSWDAVITTIIRYQDKIRCYSHNANTTAYEECLSHIETLTDPDSDEYEGLVWANLVDTYALLGFACIYVVIQIAFIFTIIKKTNAKKALHDEVERLGYICCCFSPAPKPDKGSSTSVNMTEDVPGLTQL